MGSRGQRERDRESQADPAQSMEPHTGLIPQPQDHDPRQNQESESQPTVPPRRPFTLSCCNPLVCASPGCPARSIPLCVSCVHKIIKGKQKPEDASLLSEREGKLSSSTTKGQNHTFSEHLDSSQSTASGPTPKPMRQQALGKARSQAG